MRLGSLFTGLGLLDAAVLDVFGGDLAWFAEHAPPGSRPDEERRSAYCRAVVQARHPNAVSLGDVAAIDGTQLAPVDVLALGFPCQDISPAGAGKGMDGARSGLWAHVPRILGEMRAAGTAPPRILIIENSGYLPARGLVHVLRDLHELGYTAGWQVIGANGVGAPHRRERTAVVARLDGLVPRWPELAPIAAVNVAGWYNPDREPLPRTVVPYPRGDERVRWRSIATAALGNGVNMHWARMVAQAARDAGPVPRWGLFREPVGTPVGWGEKVPRAGVMVNGALYATDRVYNSGDAERAMLETDICRLYGQLLPTPTKTTFSSNQGGSGGRTGPVRPALQTLARTLPTPTKRDAKTGGAGPETMAKNSRPLSEVAASTLSEVAASMLPAPARGDGDRGPAIRDRRPDGLVTAAAMLATPTCKGNDNRAGLTERSGDGLATQARAMPRPPRATLLHPHWVAWLMGAPAEMVPLLDSTYPLGVPAYGKGPPMRDEAEYEAAQDGDAA